MILKPSEINASKKTHPRDTIRSASYFIIKGFKSSINNNGWSAQLKGKVYKVACAPANYSSKFFTLNGFKRCHCHVEPRRV